MKIGSRRILGVTPVARLKHIEIQPGFLVKPFGGLGSSEGMKGNQVIGIPLFKGSSNGIPYFRGIIPPDIASIDPDNIRTIAVPFCQKFGIDPCLIFLNESGTYDGPPDRDERHVNSFRGGQIHHKIKIFPIIRFLRII